MIEDHEQHWHDSTDRFKLYAGLMWFCFFLIAAGLGVYLWRTW